LSHPLHPSNPWKRSARLQSGIACGNVSEPTSKARREAGKQTKHAKRCPRITVSRRPYILTSVRSSSDLPRGALVIAKRSAHQNYMPNWLQLGRADGWMPVPPWKGMKQILEEEKEGNNASECFVRSTLPFSSIPSPPYNAASARWYGNGQGGGAAKSEDLISPGAGQIENGLSV
jgi:hypothetical protein